MSKATDFAVARSKLVGPVVPLNIPYRDDGAIDVDNIVDYLEYLVANGNPIIMLTAGSSEYLYMTDAEIYELARVVGQTLAGRATYLAGAGAWPLPEVIRYVEHARRHGADAVSIHPDWRVPYNHDDMIAFHKAIVDATGVPLLSYTLGVPGMPPAFVHRLAAEAPGVIGMKNDSDQFYDYFEYIRAAGDNLIVISGGQMKNVLFGHHFGSRCYLCPFAPFAPWIANDFFAALERRDYPAAARYAIDLEAPFLEGAGAVRGGWLPYIKSVLHVRGLFRSNRMRLPAAGNSPAELDSIRALLDRLALPARKA